MFRFGPVSPLAVALLATVMSAAASSQKPPQANEAVPLVGKIGSSPEWGSGYIDLAVPTDFRRGDRLVLRTAGAATRVVVRLLSKGEPPDSSAGVIAVCVAVPPNRILEVPVPEPHVGVVQVSVHGFESPWGKYDCGRGNGRATLESAGVARTR
jgi:hypothetical protein